MDKYKQSDLFDDIEELEQDTNTIDDEEQFMYDYTDYDDEPKELDFDHYN